MKRNIYLVNAKFPSLFLLPVAKSFEHKINHVRITKVLLFDKRAFVIKINDFHILICITLKPCSQALNPLWANVSLFLPFVLREKNPYWEFFWSVLFRIRTEYGSEKLRIRTLFTQFWKPPFFKFFKKYKKAILTWNLLIKQLSREQEKQETNGTRYYADSSRFQSHRLKDLQI